MYSLSIKRFHPYFELFYFRHGKAVWSSKSSIRTVNNFFYFMHPNNLLFKDTVLELFICKTHFLNQKSKIP